MGDEGLEAVAVMLDVIRAGVNLMLDVEIGRDVRCASREGDDGSEAGKPGTWSANLDTLDLTRTLLPPLESSFGDGTGNLEADGEER